MGKHYGKEILLEVLRLKREGKTHREIGEKYGLTKEQIHDLVKRHNKKERQKASGVESRSKGRPITRQLTKDQKLELENRRLKTENSLLHSFLAVAGRM